MAGPCQGRRGRRGPDQAVPAGRKFPALWLDNNAVQDILIEDDLTGLFKGVCPRIPVICGLAVRSDKLLVRTTMLVITAFGHLPQL